MSNLDFQRSKSLNLIPQQKLREKQLAIVAACAECSKIGTNWNDENPADGLCDKCAIKYTACNRYATSNIPIEYWSLRMDKDFRGFSGLMNKYEELTKDIHTTYREGKAICFAGQHGTGKTFASCCILKKAALANYQCLYTTLSDVVAILTQPDGEDKLVARRELQMIDFLTIDEWDLRFFGSSTAAELYARVLENIFRTRIANRLPTIMCSNSPNPVEAFTGALKESLGSLIEGYMTIFPVVGEDYRKISR
jgi:DNA replication protein DnaC